MADVAFTENLRPVKTCRQCGDELPSVYGSRVRKFCSRGCSTIYHNKRRANHSEQMLMARFWEKVDKTPGFGPDGDCWKWTARVDGRGYGEIKVAGKYKKAHRLALFGMKDLSNPLFACHRCDNPQCVRPSHLFAGTSKDNVNDMIDKGRARFGSDCDNRVRVRRLECGTEYPSINAAARDVGLPVGNIYNAMTKGHRFHGSHWERIEDWFHQFPDHPIRRTLPQHRLTIATGAEDDGETYEAAMGERIRPLVCYL